MSAERERALESAVRGLIHVAQYRSICADYVCNTTHAGWEACVMYRKAVLQAQTALEMPR